MGGPGGVSERNITPSYKSQKSKTINQYRLSQNTVEQRAISISEKFDTLQPTDYDTKPQEQDVTQTVESLSNIIPSASHR